MFYWHLSPNRYMTFSYNFFMITLEIRGFLWIIVSNYLTHLQEKRIIHKYISTLNYEFLIFKRVIYKNSAAVTTKTNYIKMCWSSVANCFLLMFFFFVSWWICTVLGQSKSIDYDFTISLKYFYNNLQFMESYANGSRKLSQHIVFLHTFSSIRFIHITSLWWHTINTFSKSSILERLNKILD